MFKHKLSVIALLGASLISAGCSEVLHLTSSKPMEMKANDRTLGAKFSDREIETVARVNIKKADRQLEHAHVNIDSYNGLVLLTGQVPSDELRNLVADTVYKLNPVREVHNELVVGPATDFAARSVDSWISTKIKSQLLADETTRNARVHFITEMKTVYLMGAVTRAEAERIVSTVSRTGDVVQVVKVFEYID